MAEKTTLTHPKDISILENLTTLSKSLELAKRFVDAGNSVSNAELAKQLTANKVSKLEAGTTGSVLIPSDRDDEIKIYSSFQNEAANTAREVLSAQSNLNSIMSAFKKTQLTNVELDDDLVIPHLFNKLVTKLIEETSTNYFETYSFVSENITTFFYYNKNFTVEEVELLNNEINERLIDLTPFFGIDELLKFAFIVTAEDLSDKEKSVTYGMPCG